MVLGVRWWLCAVWCPCCGALYSSDTAGRLRQHIALAALATAVGRIPLGETHSLLRVCSEELAKALQQSAQSRADAEVLTAKLTDATSRIASLEAVSGRRRCRLRVE